MAAFVYPTAFQRDDPLRQCMSQMVPRTVPNRKRKLTYWAIRLNKEMGIRSFEDFKEKVKPESISKLSETLCNIAEEEKQPIDDAGMEDKEDVTSPVGIGDSSLHPPRERRPRPASPAEPPPAEPLSFDGQDVKLLGDILSRMRVLPYTGATIYTSFRKWVGQAHYSAFESFQRWKEQKNHPGDEKDGDDDKKFHHSVATAAVCDHCNEAFAEFNCLPCLKNYCKDCNIVLHYQQSKHFRTQLEHPKCGNCEKPAKTFCHECKLLLCADCDKRLHYLERRSHPPRRLDILRSLQSQSVLKDQATGLYFHPEIFDNATLRSRRKNEFTIAVIVPFFNEEVTELRRTLNALWEMEQMLQERNLEGNIYKLHVLMVMDGWSKASQSGKEYIMAMFPKELTNWPNDIKPVDPSRAAEQVETYELRRLKTNDITNTLIQPVNINAKTVGELEEEKANEEPVPNISAWSAACCCNKPVHAALRKRTQPVRQEDREKPERKLKITVLMKRDNRRKHNSHDWFLSAFCRAYQPRYAFATDAGTLFAPDCLFLLAQYLYRHPTVTAVTGRQRVMSAEQQGSEGEGIFSLSSWYRYAQGFDYDASLASYMGAFSLIGMLPVIPGPCGLYRWEDVGFRTQDGDEKSDKMNAIEYYLEAVKKNPDEVDMVSATLMLAEDRILSYAAVFIGKSTACSKYEPRAHFFFEAETDPLILLQQRRRWINGTIAGYISLLYTNNEVIWGSDKSWFFKMFVTFLTSCQLALYGVVTVAPGIFTLGVWFAVTELFKESTYGIENFLIYFYFLLYVFFVYLHAKPPTPGNDTRLHIWLFHVVTFINALGVLVVVGTTAYYIVQEGLPTELYAVALIMGLPFVLCLMQDPRTFLDMARKCIPFYLFLPTMVGFFGAYAFARTWELTWGNRPSDALESVKPGKTVDDQKRHKEKQYSIAATIAAFVIVLNFLLVVLVIEVQGIQSAAVWILSGVIFFFSLVQMCISAIWVIFVYYPMLLTEASCHLYQCCRSTIRGRARSEDMRDPLLEGGAAGFQQGGEAA